MTTSEVEPKRSEPAALGRAARPRGRSRGGAQPRRVKTKVPRTHTSNVPRDPLTQIWWSGGLVVWRSGLGRIVHKAGYYPVLSHEVLLELDDLVEDGIGITGCCLRSLVGGGCEEILPTITTDRRNS